MANVIQQKRKTTTGAPAVASLAVGEICLVLPDNSFYWKKDAATLVGPYTVGGSGDMAKATYDTNNNGKVDTAENAEKLNNVAANLYALLNNPAFTGVPTAPTAAGGTNNTQIATTAFVASAISALVASSPAALDTLNEFATALGNDPNFAATITAALGNKLDASSTIDGGTI